VQARLSYERTTEEKERAQQVLCYVLTELLKLLHPFMPFITRKSGRRCLTRETCHDLPVAQIPGGSRFPEEEQKMELIMDAIRAVRRPPGGDGGSAIRKARLILVTGQAETFEQGKDFIRKLAFASDLESADQAPEDLKGLISAVTHETRNIHPSC
jgi:valyl-tRNA synthetase